MRKAPIVLILCAAFLAAPRVRAASGANKTEVTVFRPAVPGGESRTGSCWTDSIAVARRGAWRCTVGNEIYDPCFSSPDLRGAVICNANPARGTAGFVLKLTRPLPQPSGQSPTHPRPWLVKLADGTDCEIQTGTIAFVAGLAVPYGCSDSKPCGDNGCPYMTGLTANFKHGQPWSADKVAFSSSSGGLKLIGREPVAVTQVWK